MKRRTGAVDTTVLGAELSIALGAATTALVLPPEERCFKIVDDNQWPNPAVPETNSEYETACYTNCIYPVHRCAQGADWESCVGFLKGNICRKGT